MRLQGFLIAGFAFAAVAATLRPGVCGPTDAVFIESTPPPAASAGRYESDYVAELRRRGVGENTPEADARPGEAYFLRATQAFRKGDFTFAIQMYQVAASWAYKPAEYNLGVMYARGQGVPVDLPRAMAWMALAAERNDKHYVDARETVYASLNKEQFDQANVIWRELKQTYGDEVALRRAKAKWAEVKASMTGSRVGSVGNLSVGVPNANSGDPSSQKPANPAMASVLAAAGVPVVRSSASTAAEAAGGSGIDGSIAYRQLRESDNPYDPKFKNGTIGTATVGPPTTVQTGASRDATADNPDPARNDQ